MAPPGAYSWLVTGASSGFGKSIALAALNIDHKVVGTTRDAQKANETNPEFSARGGVWLELDPSQPNSAEQFASCSREHGIDVLVNNAGYAFIGGVEDSSEDEVREQLEVNFYGPLRAVKACLPVMRKKGSGHIVLISSGAGFIARPGRGVYSASKYAIEAMHESLNYEACSLGINVLIVEPGAFRTPFSTRLMFPRHFSGEKGFSDAYAGTPLEMMISLSQGLKEIPPAVKGDPDKAANEIIKAVVNGHDYLRMILGTDCITAMEDKIASFKSDLEATRTIASSVDVD